MNETPIDYDVKEYLDSYKVDFPNEDEIEASIEFIMAQVPVKERKSAILARKAKVLVMNSSRELMNFSWLFWGLNGLFLLLGVISLLNVHFNPYMTVFALAPLPFFTGIFEILKSKDEGLVELELTLKYNAQQILTSRLLVVGFYNFAVNIVISAITVAVYPEVLFAKLFLAWTIPYVFVTGVAFFIALKTKGIVASGSTIAIWFVFCYGGLMNPEVTEFIHEINLFPAAGSVLLGIVIWIAIIVNVRKIEIGRERYEA
ncbi:hypothetical protein AABM38_03450 [Heyndrickxia sp. MSNUG]|uniref:hypothetical protein n=1 Tax=Heyndrickxia sp. MSNUG TaxID=3136677 RepID=UPI003C2E4681